MAGFERNPHRGLWASAVLLAACAQAAWGQSLYDWLPGEGVPGVNGIVYTATTWDPDGAGPLPQRLVIGGQFSLAGNTPAANIATWDGTTWRALGSGMDWDVRALTVWNGQLIAGGTFATAGGTPCKNIAGWDGTSWQSLAGGLDSEVDALTVYNGELIAAGNSWLGGGAVCGGEADYDPACDFNADRSIDVADLLVMVEDWGKSVE